MCVCFVKTNFTVYEGTRNFASYLIYLKIGADQGWNDGGSSAPWTWPEVKSTHC